MNPATGYTTIEVAVVEFCRERESRPELSLAEWVAEEHVRGRRVPEGMFEFRSRLVSLAHETVHGFPRLRNATVVSDTTSGGAAHLGIRVGEYVLEQFIAKGGMSTVWKAYHETSHEVVAIKFLGAGFRDSLGLGRFEREASVGAALDHKGLVKTLARGEQDGFPWIAMEYVPGGRSLESYLLDRVASEMTPAAWYQQVAEWMRQVAGALEVLHKAGVVHRDLKPSNVLIFPDGRCKLADYGLARVLDGSSLTTEGARLGTVAYMSPEQVRGENVDGRSDVFSLGVLLFELLALRRPFAGGDPIEIAQSILQMDLKSPRSIDSSVPAPLGIIALRALEKSPGCRYQTTAALGMDLDLFLSGERIKGRPIPLCTRAMRWCRKHTTLAGAMLAALIGVAGSLVVAQRLHGDNAELLAQEKHMQAAVIAERIQNLWEQLEGLEPVAPSIAPELERWRAEATRASSTLRPFEMESGQVHPGFENVEHEPELCTAIQSLRAASGGPLGSVPSLEYGWGIERRIAGARQLMETLTPGGEVALRWGELRTVLNDDPRYAGVHLDLQLGLVPIGKDPVSGLQEFWHVLSGDEPRRDSDGVIHYRGRDGIVLVLLPPGEFLFGSQSQDPEAPNYDPMTQPWLKSRTVLVEPFFISKFEVTVAQWIRLRGVDSSPYSGEFQCLAHTSPVTGVSQKGAERAMNQVGLSLPNSFEWEYATRAGTTTRWWTGDDPRALAAAENLLDLSVTDGALRREGQPEPWRDGYAFLCPVDALVGNPFGLHHVHGNVAEWLSSQHDLARPLPVKLMRDPGSPDDILYVGGSYRLSATRSTSDTRDQSLPGMSDGGTGFRPVRFMDEHVSFDQR